MPSIGTTAIAAAAGAPLLFAAAASGWTSYTVRPGDTLTDIARAHRTQVRELARVNRLSDSDRILAGSTLRVPKVRSAAAARAATATYTVRRGDTVTDIARRFKVPISRILADNHLDRRGRIYAGQHLRLPAAAVRTVTKAAAPTRTTKGYTVRSGDTLSAIAVRLRSTPAAIAKASRISVSRPIMPGQRLSVPVTAASATTGATFAGRTYPAAVVNAAAKNRSRLASRRVPGREATRALITRTAHRYGVDPNLAVAIATQESGLNQHQVSVANAIGVMQVIPSSGRWAEQLVGRRIDLLDTQDNVTAGVVILKALLRSASSTDQAIAGYYQGLASVRSRGMFADTKAYVRSVRALHARLS